MRRRYVARLNMRHASICGSLLVLAVASSFAPLRPLAPLRPRSAGGRPRASGDGAEVVEVELARPLGLTVQEVRGAVVVQSCAPRAAAAGVAPGDEIVGVSAVFGDKVWDTRGARARRRRPTPPRDRARAQARRGPRPRRGAHPEPRGRRRHTAPVARRAPRRARRRRRRLRRRRRAPPGPEERPSRFERASTRAPWGPRRATIDGRRARARPRPPRAPRRARRRSAPGSDAAAGAGRHGDVPRHLRRRGGRRRRRRRRRRRGHGRRRRPSLRRRARGPRARLGPRPPSRPRATRVTLEERVLKAEVLADVRLVEDDVRRRLEVLARLRRLREDAEAQGRLGEVEHLRAARGRGGGGAARRGGTRDDARVLRRRVRDAPEARLADLRGAAPTGRRARPAPRGARGRRPRGGARCCRRGRPSPPRA